jgi:hypothetical protein
MTIQLYITYGSTTLDLQDDGYQVLDGFYPLTASDIDQTVSDRADVWVKASDLSSMVAAIDKAFAYAREHANRLDHAWLWFAIDETSPVYRTRLLDGLCLQDSQILRRYAAARGNLHLTFERAGYWEGPEAAITLSNPSGSGTTGVTVYNRWDDDEVNYVEMADDQITGNLPTPLRLQITNNFNDAAGVGSVWVGHNAQSGPETFMPTLEAEDSTGGTPGADVFCSNGSKSDYTLASDGETLMFTWTLTAAQMQACNGRYFKVLMRFAASAGVTSVGFRPYIYYGSIVPLWRGPLVRFGSSYARVIRDLAVLQLPPWLDTFTDLSDLTLRLYGKRPAGISTTISLDYLYLLPVESYRMFEINGAVEYLSAIVDDGPLGQVYSQNGSAAARKADIVAYGSPIMVQPGLLQRLYFIAHSEMGNLSEISRTLSIKAWYRPRRLSV